MLNLLNAHCNALPRQQILQNAVRYGEYVASGTVNFIQ